MTRNTYINVVLVAILLPINSLHVLWRTEDVQLVNPWLFRNYSVDIQWYVLWLCGKVSALIIAILLYRLSRMNQVLRMAATTYLVIKGAELIMFFIDCNKSYNAYLFMYTSLSLFLILLAYPKRTSYKKKFKPIQKTEQDTAVETSYM